MRYIGNKTRLLAFIRRVLRSRGITGGQAVDPFSGTASVARALKRWGFGVVASDLMEYAHVLGRAYVQVPALPDLSPLAGELGGRPATLRGVVAFLDRLEPEPGFLHDHFTPAGNGGREHGRMYFTPVNAARIDAMRTRVEDWRREGGLSDDAYYLLLAAIIEAADRVANTTGVYASFVKSWQPNALQPLRLVAPPILRGNHCRALRRDALVLIGELEPFDLLYLDPPYNARQYPAYYHVPELIALGWFGLTPRLRGKTGLLPDADKRSDWARRRRCERAFEELIARAPCRHVVMSYNAEGIIPEATIERVFRTHGRGGTYRRYARRYKRYRSDSDGEKRRYRGDVVEEYLYCVEKP